MSYSGGGAVWALPQGYFEAVNFSGDAAGVQDALDTCEASGGGTVFVDAGAGIEITDTSIKIPNRCRLVGTGAWQSKPTFVAVASTNVTAMIENKSQDGTQEYAYIEKIQVDGKHALGATVGAGIKLSHVYVGTCVKDVLITGCSGNGLYIGGSTAVSTGQFPLFNITVTHCDDHNILITGQVDSIYGYQITSESVAAGKALMKISRSGVAGANIGHAFFGVHFEGTAACDGLLLDECSGVLVDSITHDGSNALNVVKITGTTTGTDGVFCAAGHTIRNVRGNFTTIIDDQVAGVTIGNAQGRFVTFYRSPVASSTKDKSQIIGLASQRYGGSLASASTISPDDGNFFTITGTVSVDNITNDVRHSGKRITFLTTSIVTFVHHSGGTGNIRCVDDIDFNTKASGTCEFISDGTLWYQVGGQNPTRILTLGYITDGDTTPSVKGGNLWRTANTGATTITDFDDGVDGQVIYVIFTDAVTTVTDGGNLILAGGFTSGASAGDSLTLARRNSKWYEISRSTN